jgi:hypothetical protein
MTGSNAVITGVVNRTPYLGGSEGTPFVLFELVVARSSSKGRDHLDCIMHGHDAEEWVEKLTPGTKVEVTKSNVNTNLRPVVVDNEIVRNKDNKVVLRKRTTFVVQEMEVVSDGSDQSGSQEPAAGQGEETAAGGDSDAEVAEFKHFRMPAGKATPDAIEYAKEHDIDIDLLVEKNLISPGARGVGKQALMRLLKAHGGSLTVLQDALRGVSLTPPTPVSPADDEDGVIQEGPTTDQGGGSAGDDDGQTTDEAPEGDDAAVASGDNDPAAERQVPSPAQSTSPIPIPPAPPADGDEV